MWLTNFIMSLIQQHQWWAYAIILGISIPTGPMLTVACGALSAQGVLNPYLVYIIVVVGDMIGDSAHYALGRFGGGWALSCFGPKLGITPEKINSARQFFELRRMQSLALSKLIHGPGVVGLVLAGIIQASWGRFILGCLLISLGQSFTLLTLGIVSGQAYQKVLDILNIYAALGIWLAIIFLGFKIVGYVKSRISKQFETGKIKTEPEGDI